MKNISFDNPYLLLIAIPLIAVILIPYFISVSKDNRSKGWLASLVIHVLIVITVSLAAAGLVHTTVMTRTKVYVVADVSYSSNRNLDLIDEYIRQIEASLPSNSRLGILCFGKNTEILTSSGEAVRSVKESTVDDSGSNIAAAIDEASTLFSQGEIKRIILITDGFATEDEGNTAAAVLRAMNMGIKLDAIYLDNNLREGEGEMQISDIDYTKATYLDHESKLQVLVESGAANLTATLTLSVMKDGEYIQIGERSFNTDLGVNLISFDLPTDESGDYDYKVSLSSSADISHFNNDFYFTQTVAGKRSVLLVTESFLDKMYIESFYNEAATVTTCLVNDSENDVPFTVEDLVKYDEIILSNIDIRKINNVYAFVDSLDMVVSQYGKSLITLGNLYMQNRDEENEEDDIFLRLEEILPVSFGNANRDSKLYTVVIDISRSMNDTSQLSTAKEAAEKLFSVLSDDDMVALITLAGDSQVVQLPARLGDVRSELTEKIKGLKPTQGTFIGSALSLAYQHMKDLPFEEKQVMLISDGLSSTLESENAGEIAEKMFTDGIVLSTVNVIREEDGGYLKGLAEKGGGKYYYLQNSADISDLIFVDIAEDLTESVVEKQTKVHIKSFKDGILDGIMVLPDIYGYVNSKAKLDATTVLTVDYQKSATVTAEVPLYAYRDHGNGRVVSFTSSFLNNWLSEWNSVNEQFFLNMLVSNTPKEYVNYPFSISTRREGNSSVIEVIPSEPNPRATARLYLTSPDGDFIDVEMTFNLNRYYAIVPTEDMGKYHVQIIYTYGIHSFISNTYFTRNYGDEYNSFAPYSIVDIYGFMRGVGEISEDGNISLENAKNEIDTYEVSFRIPLLIIAVCLFVLDVIVRKFTIKDLKGLFVKIQRKESEDAPA